jgi:hypothetical protein
MHTWKGRGRGRGGRRREREGERERRGRRNTVFRPHLKSQSKIHYQILDLYSQFSTAVYELATKQ